MWKEMALNAAPSSAKDDPNRFRVWDYPVKERYTHMLKVINDVGPVASRNAGYTKVRPTRPTRPTKPTRWFEGNATLCVEN